MDEASRSEQCGDGSIPTPDTATRGSQFHRHRTLSAPPEQLRGAVVAIGNFDGLHLGHCSVLARALASARRHGTPAVVLTFEPHPRTFFRPDHPVLRLTSAPQRALLLAELGFDGVVEYPFDLDVAQMTADDFVRSVLVDWLGIREIVAGVDFHFGKARSGTPELLVAAGRQHGFAVTLVDTYLQHSEAVSSTGIRRMLAAGDVVSAALALGHRYMLEGTVPGPLPPNARQATLRLQVQTPLADGTYAARFRLVDGGSAEGLAQLRSDKTMAFPVLTLQARDAATVNLADVVAVAFVDKVLDGIAGRDLDAIFQRLKPLGILDRAADQ